MNRTLLRRRSFVSSSPSRVEPASRSRPDGRPTRVARVKLALAALAAAVVLPLGASAQDTPAAGAGVGVVSNVSVVSDKVRDVSSVEAWKKSYLRDGMTERERALAAWESMVAFRHQSIPSKDFVGVEDSPFDPIKTFNVYGYNMCSGASAGVIALARHAGLEARGWSISHHSVPEVRIDGKWALLDASLVNYFEHPDGRIAGVEEIGQAVAEFYAKRPELRNDDKALRALQQSNGWTGWKAGPALLTGSKWFDWAGWWPAGTHGWYATMQEYGSPKTNYVYEYGSAAGYRVNVQLRPGERVVRNWSHRGLHVDMLESPDHPVLKGVPGKGDMKYAPKFGDLANGRVGNGTHTYDLPLASAVFRGGMLTADNLATKAEAGGAGAAVQVKDAARPATLAFRMASSYVYLGGQLKYAAAIGEGGSVAVHFSDNNGLDWREISKATVSGEQTVELLPLTLRRHDYRLKFVLTGKGTGLDAVRVHNDIQHSQRALPALDKGSNQVRFTAGPQEGTITVEGSTRPESKGKNLLYTDFHPQITGIKPGGHVRPTGTTGEVAFPIETPGDIARVRVGAHYRARDAKDGWDVLASFDGGRTFKEVGKCEGPYAGMSKYFTFEGVPSGARQVLVKFAGRQRNTIVLLDVRVDVDYREPAGGFAPVKVTYAWEENGQPKQDVRVARAPDEAYTITCAEKPVMKSIALELAE